MLYLLRGDVMKMTKDNGARLTFRTTGEVNKALEMYARRTCRTKNSIINEAVHIYVAEKILGCTIDALYGREPPGPQADLAAS